MGKREYSRAELRKKISVYAESLDIEKDDIEDMLSELEKDSWLSDKRFTEQFIFSRKNKFGIKKIAHELRTKGVNDLIISHAIDSIRSEEFSLAQKIWEKKFKGLPIDNQEKVKQIRFLQGRGIDPFIIQKILSGKSFEYI
ncbi:MAG: RecX family transcriptional regulator [Methylophilaceae bacterium]|nr:RecX family transcriptional regulator [Methylophilaceae bacterium]